MGRVERLSLSSKCRQVGSTLSVRTQHTRTMAVRYRHLLSAVQLLVIIAGLVSRTVSRVLTGGLNLYLDCPALVVLALQPLLAADWPPAP